MYQAIVDSLVRIFNEDAYLNKIISNELEKSSFSEFEKRLFTKIIYGVVENKILIDYYLQPFVKGIRVKPIIKNVLRVGAYVISFMEMANYYIVSKLVDLVKKTDFKASKFTNAVLRNYERTPLRTLENLNKKEYLSVKYSIPLEIIEILIADYGLTKTQNILKSYLDMPKINSYRFNPLGNTSFDDLKTELMTNFKDITIDDDMIYSKTALINQPFFKNGSIVAQDYSSSLPARFLAPCPGDMVLDSCSAPGMKTIQMAGMMKNKGKIIALDIYEHKLKLINENARKYQAIIIETKLQDATTANFNEQFDKILVDAPCSGLGVIGHKPDLKYHMTKAKIEELADISAKILDNVSKFLRINGILVFSTCTITKKENEQVVAKFIQNHSNFSVMEEKLILPSQSNQIITQDGFYICKLIKKEEKK